MCKQKYNFLLVLNRNLELSFFEASNHCLIWPRIQCCVIFVFKSLDCLVWTQYWSHTAFEICLFLVMHRNFLSHRWEYYWQWRSWAIRMPRDRAQSSDRITCWDLHLAWLGRLMVPNLCFIVLSNCASLSPLINVIFLFVFSYVS